MYLFIFSIMFLSKEYKKRIIDMYVTQLKKINMSEKTIGFFIRAFHVNLPVYFFIFMLYGTKLQNVFILGFLLCAFVSFVLFDGCILSKIENRIDEEDITIVDPMLEIIKIEKTNRNRMIISFIIAFIYILFAAMVFHFRFGFTLSTDDFIKEYEGVICVIHRIFSKISEFIIRNKPDEVQH